ncbi:MAG TPA: DUF1972 domain-containing protein, partial [Flavisolibacter sp.]
MSLKLKIAILGTRGIPNHYGGFEQVTEQLATGLTAAGHQVTVYNSHNHPYRQREWKGVRIVHCYDPEYRIGTAGQFFYDRNCIRHAVRYQFDVILVMGYSSSSVWWRLLPSTATVIYNMDGLEWKRSKYLWPVRRFLKYAEKLAALHAHYHIADSMGIRDHLEKTYGIHAAYIPYGAEITRQEKPGILERMKVAPGGYFMLMARMEPENNVHLALEGFGRTNTTKKFIVTGNTGTRYGRRMLRKYSHDSRIIFTGPLFDQDELHTLRANAAVYFHGHSVGGTNPSLLEAMASRVFIAAHDNAFN